MDDNVKEWLLRETHVTLSKAVETAQRTESSKKQIKEMGRPSVNTVQESEQLWKQHTRSIQCTQCGRRHKPRNCPAFGQQCLFCKKLHHFSNMCWSKQAQTRSKQIKQRPQVVESDAKFRGMIYDMEQNDTSSDGSTGDVAHLHIDLVCVEGVKKSSAWFADLSIHSGNQNVKLDTGAEVSILPLHMYNKLQVKPLLKATNMKLTTYGGATITPTGKLTCNSPAHNREWDVKFYVASVQAHPILGLEDCIHLGLIKQVCTLEQGVLTKVC